MHGQEPDDDRSATQAESSERARRILQEEQPFIHHNTDNEDVNEARNLESNPEGTPGNGSVADQEARPAQPTGKPQESKGKGKQPATPFGRFMKNRARILSIFGVVGFLITGAIAFYTTITELPRALRDQASRVVTSRVETYYRERIKPYLAKYLIGRVFLNRVGIDSCKHDTTPGSIVTKDCFYRNKQDYPRSYVGRFYQAWKDARVEEKMFDGRNGVTLLHNPDALLDPSTGRRGPLWVITTPAGNVNIDGTNPGPDTERLFETREFSDPSRAGRAQAVAFIMDGLDRMTHISEIDRMKIRKLIWRKHGLRGCNIYCQKVSTRIDAVINVPAKAKEAVFGTIISKTLPNTSLKLFLGCLFSREYSCQESDEKFRKRYDEVIIELKASKGEDHVKDLLEFSNAAKNRSEKNLGAFLANVVIKKMANRFAPALLNAVTGNIPVVNVVYATLSAAATAFTAAVTGYILYDLASGPAGQTIVTLGRAMSFVGVWNTLVTAVDERQGAKQVYNTLFDNAWNDVLKGYDKSFLWQSQYGNTANFQNYASLFPAAHAASLDEYPYVCNDDGDRIPAGQLVCPQWKLDYTPPVFEQAQKLYVPGAANEIAGNVATVGSDIIDTINAPFDAITEPILESQAAQDAMAPINEAIGPVIQDLSDEVLVPPFDTAEDIRGAKFLDAAWAGADWIVNDEIRGGLESDGAPTGWAGVLTDQQVQIQEAAIVAGIEREFAALPLWDRVFSTEYNQSFMSQLAFAAPNGIMSPLNLASSIFNPTFGMRYAMIAQNAKAAAPNPHPFNIPQYGVDDRMYTTPTRDENDTTPCVNDRTPISLNTPGAIDRGLGRAEFPEPNMCLFDQETLARYSSYFDGVPVDPETVSGGANSNFGNGQPGVVTGTLRWPIDEDDFARVTSCYGNRTDPFTGVGTDFHGGVDMVGKKGENQTLIRAADGGIVASVNPNSPSAGGFVTIKHREGFYTFYMHMVPSSITVQPKQSIGKGDVIGKQGNSGRSTASHLHFAIGPSPTISDANSLNPFNNQLGRLGRSGVYANGKECT